MAQLVGADLLVDSGFLEHPPQGGPRGLRGHRLLSRRAGKHEFPPGRVLQPEPEHLAEGFGQRRLPLLVALADDAHRPGRPVHQPDIGYLQVRNLDYRYAES